MTSRRRRASLAAAAGVLLVLGLPVPAAPPAVAQLSGPSVAVTPQRASDGQPVTVTIRTTEDRQLSFVETKLCRAGVEYQTSTGQRPAPDFESNGPNCPLLPVSTSSQASVNIPRAGLEDADTVEGVSFVYRVGAGVVEWNDLGGAPRRLTCDEQSPCALVVTLQVQEPGKVVWRPFVFSITYGSGNPLLGCGGAARGSLLAGGSDRMSDAWINWTLAECKSAARGAASGMSFVGEGAAVTQLSRGLLDLAYSATGYNREVGFLASEVAPGAPRALVAVPIAINAAVFAVAGGRAVPGRLIPFRDIKLSLEEVALMLSAGPSQLAPVESSISERNPELEAAGRLFNGEAGFLIGGPAGADSTAWYFTRWLDRLAATAWVVPSVGPQIAPEELGQPRGTHVALGTATPSFATSLSLLPGRPTVAKGLQTLSSLQNGGAWLLTDLATARSFGMTPVQVQNRKQEFIAPTPATMTAAIPDMKADENGVLVSDPEVVGGSAGAATPYPMTMVEYAFVPAEPLLEADCTPRTESQALMRQWLEFITGPGQQSLPDGMVPLTQPLLTAAKDSIAKVGAAPVTGTCAAKFAPTTTTVATTTTTTTTTAFAGTQPQPAAPASDLGLSPGLPSGASLAAGVPGARTTTTVPLVELAATPAREEQPAGSGILVSVPKFAGRAAVPMLGTLLALVGIVALHSLVTARTARGRSHDEHRSTTGAGAGG